MTRSTKRHSIILAVLLALVAQEPASSEVASREDEVRAAVTLFGRAFVEADLSALDALLTDNYVHVNGGTGNVLTRNEWLAWVKTNRAALESGSLVVSEYRVEELEIVLHGDAAVVTGVVISSGSRSGDPFSTRLRFSNLWVFRESVWRRAAFHDSPILEASD